jgi:hypothetical protein
MAPMRLASILLAALLVSPMAPATDIFRCTDANGTTYQDTPCAPGFAQTVTHYADPPPPPPAPAPPPADDTIPTTVEATPAPAPAPQVAAPDFYLCTATDGSRYISEDGVGRRSAVPFAMVSGNRQTLAQAYGGPNGIGVSAPELQNRPSIPASKDPLGASYVWVVDECHRAGADEACAYLRGELEKVGGKLRRAFSDTEAQLKQEQAALRERMHGCPSA